jgi:hypothetical protein
MTLELIDIALSERHSHPRLQNRITGKVRAVLAETIGGRVIEHEIFVPVWIDAAEDTPEDDIELSLMVKAADIIGRLKSRLSSSREHVSVSALSPETAEAVNDDFSVQAENLPPAVSNIAPE